MLAVQGVPAEQTARTLGIAPGTLRTHRQAIRRKLSVPRYQPLDLFLRARLGTIINRPEVHPRQEAAPRTPPAERREQLLLRFTLEEVRGLARRADAQARRLQVLAQADAQGAQSIAAEADGLAAVSEALAETYRDLVRHLRRESRSESA